mmetsp:Transcript_61510/g.148062  ORF Transcript_61510/g.148062 Transcript_61510/m.148062 type:complete len:218 (-) Transcript_61510:133-786(-)
MPSAMQWWMRAISALLPSPMSSISWNCQSGWAGSSGCEHSSPTRSRSTSSRLWPRSGSGTSATTWRAMSKSLSSTHSAPISASSTTRWRKRGYFSSRSATRSRSAASVMPGRIDQTPTIIIKLASVSMRSQAVSTLDMRSLIWPKSVSSVASFSRPKLVALVRSIVTRSTPLIQPGEPREPERPVRSRRRRLQEPARAAGQHDAAEDLCAVQAGQQW